MAEDTKAVPTVDLFRPEDAPGIARCYREIYGESFPMAYVYDPDQIVAHNRGEDHYTVVGRLPDGDIAGLAGLFRSAPDPGVYEAGQLMVRKEFRHTPLAMRLANAVFDELPARLGVKAVYGEALCNHVISQKVALKKGQLPCGLELECLSGESFDAQGPLERKISLLLVFRIHRDRSHAIYPHARYADFVRGRVAALGAERSIETASAGGQGPSLSEFSVIPGAQLARLVVRKAGSDWPAVLDEAEKRAGGCIFQVQLSLGEPASPWAVEELRRRGFFLAGYLPLWFGGDGIALQRLPEAPDFSAVQLHGAEAEAVMKAVRTDYDRAQALGL